MTLFLIASVAMVWMLVYARNRGPARGVFGLGAMIHAGLDIVFGLAATLAICAVYGLLRAWGWL